MKMKNIKIIIISLLSLLFLFSCYEDKGNYDYKKLNEINISGLQPTYYLNVGDTLKLKPHLSFAVDSNASCTCSWKLDMDTVICDTKELEYIIPPTSPESVQLVFTIKDDKSKFTTQFSMSLMISQKYANGWLILSEKDGRSSLDFFRHPNVSEIVTELEVTEFFDVYKTTMKEDLGSQPMYLRQHWRSKQEELGHVVVVQKGGQGSVDLLGGNLTKSLEIEKEFSQVPENFDPKDVLYADQFSYILNSNGKIFSRKNFSDVAFHSGYFSHYPVGFDDEGEFKELNVDRFIHGVNYSQSNGGFVLTYDKANKRFLALRDVKGYTNIDRSGEIVGVDNTVSYPQNFIKLHNIENNELFFSYGHSVSMGQGLYNIFKTPEGKYVEQQITLYLNTSGKTSLNVTAKKQRNIPDGYIDENSIVDVPDGSYYGTKNVFISKGNKLNYCSRTMDGEEIGETVSFSEYFTFDSDIVAMDDQHWQNKILCVALANGEVYFMNISNEALAGKTEKILHKVSKPLGKIKQILYKCSNFTM